MEPISTMFFIDPATQDITPVSVIKDGAILRPMHMSVTFFATTELDPESSVHVHLMTNPGTGAADLVLLDNIDDAETFRLRGGAVPTTVRWLYHEATNAIIPVHTTIRAFNELKVDFNDPSMRLAFKDLVFSADTVMTDNGTPFHLLLGCDRQAKLFDKLDDAKAHHAWRMAQRDIKDASAIQAKLMALSLQNLTDVLGIIDAKLAGQCTAQAKAKAQAALPNDKEA